MKGLDIKKARNISIYLFGAILNKGISYLSTPIFTRLMSKKDFGVLSLTTTWITIISIFVGAQISGTIPSAYVKYRQKVDRYISNVLLLSLITMIGFMTAGLLFREVLSSWMGLTNLIVLPVIIYISYGKSMSNLYISYTIQKKQPLSNVIFSSSVSLSVLLIGCIVTCVIPNEKYWGKIIGEIIVYSVVICFIYFRFTIWKGCQEPNCWREELTLSIPLIFHLLATNIISQSDRIFVTRMIGYDAMAVYSVAYTIGMVALVVVEAAFNVWMPWFFSQIGYGDRRDLINRNARIMIVLIALIHGLVIVFSTEFFLIMAPESYVGGISCTVLITISTLFSFFYRFPLCYEQYCRKMGWVAIATGVASISNIILNFLMIPILGIEGAAIATIISTVFLWLIHELVVRRRMEGYPIGFYHYFIGIAAVLPMVIIQILFQDYLPARMVMSFLYVCAVLYALYREYGYILKCRE